MKSEELKMLKITVIDETEKMERTKEKHAALREGVSEVKLDCKAAANAVVQLRKYVLKLNLMIEQQVVR